MDRRKVIRLANRVTKTTRRINKRHNDGTRSNCGKFLATLRRVPARKWVFVRPGA